MTAAKGAERSGSLIDGARPRGGIAMVPAPQETLSMTAELPIPNDAGARPAPLKSEAVRRLLSRRNGATVDEIRAATAWQPHSVRAHLSGLRKRGSDITREDRRDGSNAYRLVKAPAVSAGDQ